MIFSYGTGNTVEKVIGTAPGNLRPGTTLKQAIDIVRPTLGCGQNVEGLIGGIPQDDDLVLTNEMGRVSIQDRACSKAV